MIEDMTGCWLPVSAWSDDEEFGRNRTGATSTCDYGTKAVADSWWDAVKETLCGGDPVLLLVERLEGAKDKGNTHYLLALGYQEEKGRRGSKRCTLLVKDPMLGDELLEAELWAARPAGGPQAELTTQQNGATLDRYAILEAAHLEGPPGRGGGADGADGAEDEAENREEGGVEEVEEGGGEKGGQVEDSVSGAALSSSAGAAAEEKRENDGKAVAAECGDSQTGNGGEVERRRD